MVGRKPTLFVEPGEQFGRLTVVDPERRRDRPNGQGTERVALCRCECGNQREFSIARLRKGDVDSCGCLTRERLCAQYALSEADLSEHSQLYLVHYLMMKRCYEPGHNGYENYGDRGISVWEPWHDVRQFIEEIERDLGPHVYPMTLDRIDNNGNYEPGNVRWATWSEQNANRRSRPG